MCSSPPVNCCTWRTSPDHDAASRSTEPFAPRASSVSFLRTNENDGKFMVVGYGPIRRSPTFDGLWEIHCGLLDVARQDPPFAAWMPLSDISRYPIGSLLGKRPGKLVDTARRVKILGAQKVEFGEEARENRVYVVDLFQPRETVQHILERNSHIAVYGNGRDEVAIDIAEIFRFYCGGISLLVEPLLNVVVGEGSPIDLFINPGESGWDGNTFVIAPRRSFCGTGSVLQLALALTDPTVRALLQLEFHQMKEQLRSHPFALPRGVPSGPLDLAVVGEAIDFAADGVPSHRRFMVREIVADLRPPPFAELVVKYPFNAYEYEDADDDEQQNPDGKDRRREAVTGSTHLTKKEQPAPRPFRVGSTKGRFSSMFPAWRGAKVRYDFKGRIKVPRLRSRPAGGLKEAREASDLPGVSSGKLTRLMHAPKVTPDFLGSVSPRRRVPVAFCDPEPAIFLVPQVVSSASLTPGLRTFFRAGVELMNWQDEALSPNIPRQAGDVVVYELPPEWGGIARTGADGGPRRIGALPFAFENGFVWAIEIERRRPDEHLAIGIVSAIREVLDEITLLNAVLHAVCRRSARKRGDDPRGTWPDAEFFDVRLASVRHTRERAHYINLATKLLERSRYLLRPSDGP